MNKILSRTLSQRSSNFVKIVEVGPRDGLQNESGIVPASVKINFINQLTDAGLQAIEVTSFVSSKWVPQMGDNKEVFAGIRKRPGVSYPVLIPNVKGLEDAFSLKDLEEIAVFGSASDGFSIKNVNCTAAESIERIRTVMDRARERNLRVRGYVSCVVGCPYDGDIKPSAVTKVTEALLKLGCYEVSLGDTIGVGTNKTMHAMMKDLMKLTTPDKLAIHCHDTYGQALVNVCTAMDYGVTVVDSSTSGLGGCPYAKGATGNVATEDLVYMLHGLGMETGLDLRKLVNAGHYISAEIKKPTASRVNAALYKKYKMDHEPSTSGPSNVFVAAM